TMPFGSDLLADSSVSANNKLDRLIQASASADSELESTLHRGIGSHSESIAESAISAAVSRVIVSASSISARGDLVGKYVRIVTMSSGRVATEAGFNQAGFNRASFSTPGLEKGAFGAGSALEADYET